jgi:hypothetical protein
MLQPVAAGGAVDVPGGIALGATLLMLLGGNMPSVETATLGLVLPSVLTPLAAVVALASTATGWPTAEFMLVTATGGCALGTGAPTLPCVVPCTDESGGASSLPPVSLGSALLLAAPTGARLNAVSFDEQFANHKPNTATAYVLTAKLLPLTMCGG